MVFSDISFSLNCFNINNDNFRANLPQNKTVLKFGEPLFTISHFAVVIFHGQNIFLQK